MYRLQLLILILILIPACDWDKYFGYDHTAQELIKSTRISGKITNFYTEEPVFYARIRFGAQDALTDVFGQYYIDYLLSGDEERNKEVEFEIKAENYFPLTAKTLLKPTGNMFNYQLRYAAPIIKQTARVEIGGEDGEIIFQAIVMDYQGNDNIKRVWVTYYYTSQSDSAQAELGRIHSASANTGYYQARLTHKQLLPYYHIRAVDNDSFSNHRFFSINIYMPDTLLFDPDL